MNPITPMKWMNSHRQASKGVWRFIRRDPSKYMPHQGKREMARRVLQMAARPV